MKYTGVNIAGGDFAPQSLPGRYGTDYIYPDHNTIDYFAAKGMNIIRVPALWERLQHQLGGDLDSAEMRRLDDVVDYAASKGMRVILDVHNYAAYRGAMIGTESVPANALGDLWGRIAERYKDNDAVIFGLMNEPNNLPTETWLEAANIAIAEIRTDRRQEPHPRARRRLVIGTQLGRGRLWNAQLPRPCSRSRTPPTISPTRCISTSMPTGPERAPTARAWMSALRRFLP